MIAHRTLTTLGLPSELIKVHLLLKGVGLFQETERDRMEKLVNDELAATSSREARVIILDQGSRPGQPLVRPSATNAPLRTLIIDHHMSDSWPEEAQVLSACHSPPISTSSLLTYLTCAPLHPDLPQATMWYSALGVFGDLGPSEIKWGDASSEWPASSEMTEIGEEIKRTGKKALNSAVGAINARVSD